ncbi:hypothetical protein NE237_000684 [Protea cynaroides]|uniref:C2 domain-containing protein n=1 Tax=Protea cynaroides TaxID=273540 RepID=A0A9Q0KRQ4_9MAGN|nr:hypothetical protein NE237_000684 [Protea cynaroides]
MQRLPPPKDYSLRVTSSYLGGGGVTGDKLTSTNDRVEQMQYLYVRVVKVKDLPAEGITGRLEPYIEVKLGNYKGTTRHFEKKTNPEWNQVFAFSKDRIQSSVLEVIVKDNKDVVKDDFVGRVMVDFDEVPKRVPSESPLAPQWYRLEDQNRDKIKGELMLAVWMGTQADKAFPEAWHSDAGAVSDEGLANIRSKVYLSPKLWYVRINVIEAQDLQSSENNRYPEVFVRAKLGNQALRTNISQSRNGNPMWNEDLMLVAAEPFEEHLVLSVEYRVGPNKDEVLGKCMIPLQNVEKRLDYKPVNNRWCNLEKHVVVSGEQEKEIKFASRIHLRICLEGGYHVLDECTHYISDFRPNAKQLWKHSVGVLELRVLKAQGLMPMNTKDGRGTTDAYCVAKYGQKWVRTRTIIDSFTPKWNEQYTWEVFDPFTVITIGVFNNGHLHGGRANDSKIGKVRIRLSMLEINRFYTHSYPLLALHPSGVKKMGEVQLAVRFTCSSLLNIMYTYTKPLLPKMHYLHPLSVSQIDYLSYQATQILSMRLSRAEPPLRKEVVEYMLDVDSNMWSMRRSKANYYRIMGVLSGLIAVGRWFDQICNWKNPLTTVLIHTSFVILVLYPKLILLTVFLFFMIGVLYYRWRPRNQPDMDTRLCYAGSANSDELDEEFDTFLASRPPDIVRLRYDRLRSVAGRIQTVVGDLATQGERLQSLLSWNDPRATALFVTFCLIAAIVLYVTPFRVVALITGFYVLSHQTFRHKLHSVPLNFFRRLPAITDTML